MKGFKQIFAVIFAVATVVFGVLVMIGDRDVFESLKLVSAQDDLERGIGILAIIVLSVDVLLIALPFFGLVLVALGKFDPFKAITDCALVVLGKFLISIFAFMLLMSVWKAPAETWNAYLFGKDSLAIIPLLVFFFAFVFVMIAKASNLQGTIARTIFACLGSGLAVFGLIFYYVLGNGSALIGSNPNPDALDIFGLVLGIACYAGLVVYCFLPQAKESK